MHELLLIIRQTITPAVIRKSWLVDLHGGSFSSKCIKNENFIMHVTLYTRLLSEIVLTKRNEKQKKLEEAKQMGFKEVTKLL